MDDFLKQMAGNAEQRYISYKQLMEQVGRDRINFPPNDEFVIWFKSHIREMKNESESYMKLLKDEITDTRQGLLPAFYYTHEKKQKAD